MNNIRNTGLAACIAVFLFASPGGVPSVRSEDTATQTPSGNAAARPDKRPGEGVAAAHARINAKVQQGNVDLILLGDSITDKWRKVPSQNRFFGKWDTVNAGISGDKIQHLLWRLDNGNLAGIQPKVAVVLIGTNNSNEDDHTAEEIAEGIAAVVCKLRTALPQTKVLLLGIFPRGSYEQRTDESLKAAGMNPQWEKNDKASMLASRMADGDRVVYLNINQAFLDEAGRLSRDVMPDLLHPNEKGYELWGNAMMPVLEKMMENKTEGTL